MPVRFRCPHCHHETLVDDQYVGREGPCVMCGRPIVVSATTVKSWEGEVQRAGVGRRRYSVLAVLAGVTVVVSLGMVASFLLYSTTTGWTDRRRREECAERMVAILNALQRYHRRYGTFPPPVVFDKQGRPVHSWRGLLLDEFQLSRAAPPYRLDLPWDSADNMSTAAALPPIYVCPADSESLEHGWTNYLLVTGEGTCFPPGTSRAASLGDVAGDRVILIECRGTRIEWLEPKDVDIGVLPRGVNSVPGSISSHHRGGANVGRVDGTVEFFSESMPDRLIRERLQVEPLRRSE